MNESQGSCWPEQEAVWAWMHRHGIDLPHKTVLDLCESVTSERVKAQRKLERVRAHLLSVIEGE